LARDSDRSDAVINAYLERLVVAICEQSSASMETISLSRSKHLSSASEMVMLLALSTSMPMNERGKTLEVLQERCSNELPQLFFNKHPKMLSRSVSRLSDFAHKQVSSGFSKKYGDNFDKIFGKKKTSTSASMKNSEKKPNSTNKSESK